MTKEQFEREKNYQVSRSIVSSWLKKGIITEKEYKKIDTKLVAKFQPIIGTLNLRNHLILCGLYGNM